MKKLMVFAVAATLLATSAFAQSGRRLVAEPNATFTFGAPGVGFGPTTTNNDDSCDIGVAPAATLLLPYFEVEVNEPVNTARTTLFTITNTSYLPQIAHVTLWTDWSFPVIDFNIFLTGYDVQSINLYDLLGGGGRPGFIANSPVGTSITTVPANNATQVGIYAQPAQGNQAVANPNFLAGAAADCVNLLGTIPAPLLQDAVALLTTGRTTGNIITCTPATAQVGGNHPGRAIGYATIDVAATCSIALPTNSAYYSTEILFDNVFIGEYYDVNPDPAATGAGAGNFAGGNPMVHIRAIPEGGAAGAPAVATNLPYTFYDRYTPTTARTIDRRQPLPSTFAARWISGATALFDTRYKVWREGLTSGTAGCADYVRNGAMPMTAIVRFDEAENANVLAGGLPVISPQPIGAAATLPEASQTPISTATVFPILSNAQANAVGGWTYMNLNNTGSAGTRVAAANVYSTQAGRIFYGPGTSTATVAEARQSQNWVIVSMFAEGRYGVDYDAAWLGNGCSVSPSATTQIGPTGGVLVCPPGGGCTSDGVTYTNTLTGRTATAGTNVTP